MIKVNGRLEVDNVGELIAKRGLERGGRAQKYIDSEVLRKCAPMVPKETSELIQSGLQETVTGNGKVIYDTLYARRWYYNPAITDSLGRHFGPAQFEGAPTRGSYWFDRMLNEGGREEILNGVKKITGAR